MWVGHTANMAQQHSTRKVTGFYGDQPAANIVGEDDATQVRMDGGVGIGAEDSYFSGGAFGRLS